MINTISKFIPAASASYAEESQSLPFRMALCERNGCEKDCDETYTALHDWIKCRDFVAEALFSEFIDKPLSIYSFSWKNNYKDRPLLSSDTLCVAFKGDLCKLAANLPLLQDFESSCGMVASEIRETDVEGVVVLESDIGWRKSCTMLNLYSLMVKALMMGDGDDMGGVVSSIISSTESSYSREKAYWGVITGTEGFEGVERLVKDRDSIFDINWKDFKDTSTGTLHHGHGPVAFFTAVKWVRGGEKDPSCCEVIKPSVLRFCNESAYEGNN